MTSKTVTPDLSRIPSPRKAYGSLDAPRVRRERANEPTREGQRTAGAIARRFCEVRLSPASAAEPRSQTAKNRLREGAACASAARGRCGSSQARTRGTRRGGSSRRRGSPARSIDRSCRPRPTRVDSRTADWCPSSSRARRRRRRRPRLRSLPTALDPFPRCLHARRSAATWEERGAHRPRRPHHSRDAARHCRPS